MALCLTQSAISQQIRQLNLLIGTPVFTSTGSNLQLSEAGAELLGYARRIVALNDETVSRFVTPRGRRQLTLGVADQLADALPGMLRLLARRAPDARISVRTGQSDSLREQLSAGVLRSALLLGSEQPGRGHETHELGRLPLRWFGRPSHRPDDALPLVLFAEPCALRGQLTRSLSQKARPWRVGYEGSDLVGVRAAVRAGLGYGCLIAHAGALWDLEPATHPALPAPPRPVPVTLAMTPGLSAGVRRGLTTAARDALGDYPLAAGPAVEPLLAAT